MTTWVEYVEVNMAPEKVVALPKSMPLSKRISEAKKQLEEWLKSLGKPINKNRILRLKAWEQVDKEFKYHYEIIGREED